MRVLLPFAAVPVFAGWNALIAWWVIREARVRAAGPLAVREAVTALERADLDTAGQRLALDAVAELVVAAADAHPNYDLLLAHLRETFDIEPHVTHWPDVRARLARADGGTQRAVLALMTTTAALRGRSRRRQRHVLASAYAACDTAMNDALRRAQRRIAEGR